MYPDLFYLCIQIYNTKIGRRRYNAAVVVSDANFEIAIHQW